MSLYKKLSNYSKSNSVRFHMPGHKGRMVGFNPYAVDVTEVLDFDDLHNPSDSILELNSGLSDYFGSHDARLLVNGTTSGIMAAIFSMINPEDKVLIPKSSHKSVYNGLVLRRANPIFIEQSIDENGILLPLKAEDVERTLEENSDIKLGIFTYPTYEGVFCELKDIICLLHNKNIPVLVDAAHGAHLIDPEYLEADISVVSLHKTLPFFTQTSCMLFSQWGSKYIEKADYYLSCFESSSPSYILMAGADIGLGLLEKDRDNLYKNLNKNLDKFYEKAKSLKNISIINEKYTDKTKIIITTDKEAGIETIEEALLKSDIVPEMTTQGYILCMASIMNTEEDFEKLFEALDNIDKDLCIYNKKRQKIIRIPTGKYKCKMYEAFENGSKSLEFEKAVGEISSGFVEMFPPGIPFIIPGQIIEKEHIELVKNAKESKINIRGLKNNKITVV